MGKMLMGQIDHARNRVKALSNEKLGESPTAPEMKGVQDLKNGLRDGTVVISAKKLNRAFEAWNSNEEFKAVDSSSRYDYNLPGRPYVTVYSVITKQHSSLDSYLAAVQFEATNAATVRRYMEEREVYESRKTLILSEAVQVEDAIVLGDQQAALIALQAFAAFEV